jgi:hypothetical protein
MAGKISPTLRVLQDIRNELREHGAILREHGSLLQEHSGRLEALERLQLQMQTRVSTELTALTGTMTEVRDLLRQVFVDRQRIDDHEVRLRALERKVG